jgi:gas vesicle protein
MEDMEEKSNNCRTSGLFLTSLTIGLVAGLAIGFLYAPRRGEETRRRLSRKAKIAEAKAVRVVKKSTETARQAIKNRLQNANPIE